MKKFYCGAVVPGCQTTFLADSEEEILAKVATHAREAHGMEEVGDEVVAQVRANIREPG